MVLSDWGSSSVDSKLSNNQGRTGRGGRLVGYQGVGSTEISENLIV